MATKRPGRKRAPRKDARSNAGPKKERSRRTTLFPAASFEEALTIANAIQKHAAGQKVRRLTLFDQIGKSPDSGPSRQLIVNSNKYGLTKGGYKAEHLELTPDGKLATGADVAARERLKARFRLAIERIAPFKALYDAQVGNRLPANSVLEDLVRDHGVPNDDAKECVEMFIVNAKFLGILKPIAGAERILPLDQALEGLPASSPQPIDAGEPEVGEPPRETVVARPGAEEWESIRFYIPRSGTMRASTGNTLISFFWVNCRAHVGGVRPQVGSR